MQVPRPDSLVSRTVETLRASIQNEEIGPLLPGEPRLASTLGVARRTLRSALEILTREGWITESSRGSSRRVTPKVIKTQSSRQFTVAVMLPSPLDALASGTQDFLREVENKLSSDNAVVHYHYHNVYHLKHPKSRLEKILTEQNADLWLLYEASAPMASFFKKSGVPTVICGGPVSDPAIPYVAFDGVATLRHAIGVLSRAGHTKISAPMHFARPGRSEAFQEEMTSRNLPFDPDFNTPNWDSNNQQMVDLLRSLLESPNRPTAIIINGMDAAITLYSMLLEIGLTIPNDISVILSGSDPLFSHFHPQLSYYSTSHKLLASATAKLIRKHLRNPGTPPKKELLLMEYIAGQSVGPAPKTHH